MLVKHTDGPESTPYFTLGNLAVSHVSTGISDENAELLREVGGGLKAELAAYP